MVLKEWKKKLRKGLKMPDDDILEESVNRTLQSMTILFTAKALRTAITLDEFIQNSIVNGATLSEIETLLLNDLRNNGRIFGEFTRAIKATSNGIINNFRDDGMLAEFGLDDQFRWVAVLVNTCPDCLSRHNDVSKTWEEWEAKGLPRTGFTVCKQHCKCMLIPVDEIAEIESIEPIKRNKKR